MSKTDYILTYKQGKLDSSHLIFKAYVVVNGKDVELIKIGEAKVSNGYGVNKEAAISDFIKRNQSNVIERIFDVETK